MRILKCLPSWGLAIAVALIAPPSSAWAQAQYIGYVYPAGGQQGTTFPIRLGGQRLTHASDLVVTGDGVSVRLVDYYRVMDNQELSLLRQQLNELRNQETPLSDAMVAKMAWFEFPGPIGPVAASDMADYLICTVCGVANPLDATVCSRCNANLEKPEEPEADGEDAEGEEPEERLTPEQARAKQNLIERLERILAEDERQAAVRSHTELVFAEVTIAADAQPGRREIRVITEQGISNALPFYVGQTPEVSRTAMKTARNPVLGMEHLAQRNRPPEEEEMLVAVPCTMNGQIAAGELNRYRFYATQGQRLVISALARELIPYVADGVPGWFQAVLRLHDSDGREVAYNDDFRFHPDPLIYYEVPEDGEYVLTINEALFRGRESFVYRIILGELPYLTSIFPLGARVGETVEIEMEGWNLDNATLTPPPNDAEPGNHWIAAADGSLVSNYLPFARGTLPECFEQEPNDQPATAQKVELPIVINGRVDSPGDWDVFELEGRAGQTIVAEVHARRLGSPLDSFVKVTDEAGRILALNDDHHDAASGLNTDHADSYLMMDLPADGSYFVHLGDTRGQGGSEYAYRLRISEPRPDFQLRVVPSRVVMRSNGAANLTVFAIRRDGFEGPIRLSFPDLPEGLASPGATLGAGETSVGLRVSTSLTKLDQPVNVTVLGTANTGDTEIVRPAVPAEDTMQAFLWRHLLPAEDLPALVFDPSYQAPTDRIRPPIRDEDRPQDQERTLREQWTRAELNRIERLYQEWLLTDQFANSRIATIEARIIRPEEP